jgi:hypothetical protein
MLFQQTQTVQQTLITATVKKGNTFDACAMLQDAHQSSKLGVFLMQAEVHMNA